MNFSVAIPTCKRLDSLEKCVVSILEQVVLPTEVFIIDDGDLSAQSIQKIKNKLENKGIRGIYYRKNHNRELKGTSVSRNIGIKLADTEILFILDDDVILDKNFFVNIIKIWQENKDKRLIGVGGVIKNNRKKNKLEILYNKVFGLESRLSWDVNPVGFQIWNDGLEEKQKGYYVHGGACSYNKRLVKDLDFATFGGGRAALEDVDFCLRAKNRSYYFIVEPKAKVTHRKSSISKEKNFLIGFKESYNRKLIFRNNCKKNIKNYIWFWWANIGWILRQILGGHFSRGVGMVKGLFYSTKIS